MDFSNYVKEFRGLQKNQRIRVADFCRERMLDYFEMVEALKKDKFLSEMPDEKVEAAELEVTNLPLDHPDPAAASFIQEVSIQTPTHLKVRICGITASDLITVVSKLMTIRPCWVLQEEWSTFKRRTLEQISYPRESQTEIGKLPTSTPDGSQR